MKILFSTLFCVPHVLCLELRQSSDDSQVMEGDGPIVAQKQHETLNHVHQDSTRAIEQKVDLLMNGQFEDVGLMDGQQGRLVIRGLMQRLLNGEEKALVALIALAKGTQHSWYQHFRQKASEEPLKQVYDQIDRETNQCTRTCSAHSSASVLHQRLIDMYPGLKLRDVLPWLKNDREIHDFLVSLAGRHKKQGGNFWYFLYMVGPTLGALIKLLGNPNHNHLGLRLMDHELLKLVRVVEDNQSHRNEAFINDSLLKSAQYPFLYSEKTVPKNGHYKDHGTVLVGPSSQGEAQYELLDSYGVHLESYPGHSHRTTGTGGYQILDMQEFPEYRGHDGSTYTIDTRMLYGLADPGEEMSSHPMSMCTKNVFYHVLTSMLQYRGQIDELQRRFPDGLNIELFGATALHIAARLHNIEAVGMIFHDLRLRNMDVVDAINRPSHEVALGGERGSTPFCYSLMDPGLDVARMMAEVGADINARNYNGYSCFYLSIILQNLDAARFLLERGAKIDLPNKVGFTPLHASIGDGMASETILFLIENNADVNAAWPTHGRTPLEVVLGQIERAKNDVDTLQQLEAVKSSLLKHGAKVYQDKFKGMLIKPAVDNTNFEQIKLILKNHPDISLQTTAGQTPLDLVFEKIEQSNLDMTARTKYHQMAKYLMEHHAAAHIYRQPLKSYRLFAELLDFGQLVLAQLVVDGWLIEEEANVNPLTARRYTPLDFVFEKVTDRQLGPADRSKYFAMATCLYERGGIANIHRDPVRSCDLLNALLNFGQRALADRVADGCDLDHIFAPGPGTNIPTTFLQRACKHNHFALAVFIVGRRPQMISQTTGQFEYAPLHLAVMNPDVSTDFLTFLLVSGANVNQKLSDGYTPVDLVLEHLKSDKIGGSQKEKFRGHLNLLMQHGGENQEQTH